MSSHSGILAVELCVEQISSAKVRRRFVVSDYLISTIISAAFLIAFLASTFQVRHSTKDNITAREDIGTEFKSNIVFNYSIASTF